MNDDLAETISQALEACNGDNARATKLLVAIFKSHIKSAAEAERSRIVLEQRERWTAQRRAHRAQNCLQTVRGQKIDTSSDTGLKKEDINPLSADSPRTKADVASESFSSFWRMYPVKKGKADALRAWRKAAPKVGGEVALLDLVTKALAWQVKGRQFTEKNGAFIPHPATYLNRGQWDDEPEAPARPTPKPEQYNPYRKVGPS